MRKAKSILTALCLLFALGALGAVRAQSTLMNIPTTDVVSQKKVYFEYDFLLQTPKSESETVAGTTFDFARLKTHVPRVVVGLGRDVEIGTNVAFAHFGDTKANGASQDDAFTQIYFQPNIKWRFYNNEETGMAASGGAILYTPVNNRDDNETFGLIYTNVSKKVKHTYGPRITAGAYGIVGSSDADFAGPRAGAILGYEQPVHSRLNIVADWYSGKNGFGYFTPGVSITLPRSSLLNIGYSIGNNAFRKSSSDYDRTNRFLFVYFGITLP